jgi:hypothetical protein
LFDLPYVLPVLLTGRLTKEFSAFGLDGLEEIQAVHRRARWGLHQMCLALWPEEVALSLLSDLTEKMKGTVKHFDVWKKSACREGAREA